MTTAVQPFTGPFSADLVHSSFAFAVRYSGLSDYRGTLSEVRATLSPGDAGLTLEGEAAVDSISIKNPPQFRSHVLGPEFFDVANHPTVSFRSTSVELADDGSARVEGDLSIAGPPGRSWPPAPGSSLAPGRAARRRDSSSRRALTAVSSAWTGRWSCPAAASPSTTKSRSPRTCR